jgi:CrcB protein
VLTNILIVFSSGGLGAISRWGLSNLVMKFTSKFWVGTLIVNLFGCLLFYLSSKWGLKESSSLMVRTGFLGSLTTFSTFSFELYSLFTRGLWLEFGVVLFLNIFFGVAIGVLILR